MKPEIAKALSDHLDSRNQQKREAEVRASERERQIAKNVGDFDAAKNTVIKPALQEIVDLYRDKGIAIRVTEEDEVVNRNGGIRSANIGIDMAAAYPSHSSDMKPRFTISFDKGKRELSVYTSTGHQAGPGGGISLDAVTAEWIHGRFAKFQGLSASE